MLAANVMQTMQWKTRAHIPPLNRLCPTLASAKANDFCSGRRVGCDHSPKQATRLPLQGAQDRQQLLHHQDEQQLPAAHLRPFDHERTPLAQLRVRLEQKLIFFVKFQVQNVARFGLAPCIDMQRKVLTGSSPIFLTGLECLARLPDDLELIVAEKFFQRLLDSY